MSNKALTWAQAQTVGHSGAKFVLMVLADYADEEWTCFPSVRKIGETTELHESSVRRALALLTANGLIRVFGRKRPDHTQRSSRYQLLPDGTDTPQPETCDWVYVRAADEGTGADGEGTVAEEQGGTVAHEQALPHKEPSPKEPSPVIPGASRPTIPTRIPDNYIPDEKMRAWFAEEQLHQVIDVRTEHAKFVDYWLGAPGIKGRKLDWPATWRNWMRTAAERAGRRPGNSLMPISGAPQHYKSTTDGKVMQTLGLAEKFRQMEESQ